MKAQPCRPHARRPRLLWVLALTGILFAAPCPLVHAASLDLDATFRQAQTLASAQHRAQARALLEDILQQAPRYWDAAVLLARIDLWEGHYGAARKRLQEVLVAEPDYHDARVALIDLEYVSGHRQAASELCDAALVSEPGNAELLERRARIDAALTAERRAAARKGEATGHEDRGRSGTPSPEAATAPAAPGTPAKGGRYRASFEYEVARFDQDFDPWHRATWGLERRGVYGSIIGRASYLNRFNDAAAQFEVEAYPILRKGTYAELAASVSTRNILPDYTWVAEVYQALPAGLEGSFGWRQVHFDSTTDIATASLGWYAGDYWTSLRALVADNSLGTTTSWVGKVRRYFADPEEYVTLTASTGRSLETDTASQSLFNLDARGITLEGRKRIDAHIVLRASLGQDSQELPGGRSRREQTTVAVGADYLF